MPTGNRPLADYIRKRRTLHWPITLSAALMVLNVTLMVCWIVLFAQLNSLGALTIGTIAFALVLIGLSFYLFLTIKEIQLNRRQANFVDSVTHELKTPLASIRLYLETLQLRELDEERRSEFYEVMQRQLVRLDTLISHLLEIGRLDAIGQTQKPRTSSSNRCCVAAPRPPATGTSANTRTSSNSTSRKPPSTPARSGSR